MTHHESNTSLSVNDVHTSEVTTMDTCPSCGGSGSRSCSNCGGTGKMNPGDPYSLSCSFCGGDGSNNCSRCGGSGSV